MDFPESCRKKIAHGQDGDARKAINAVELAILVADEVDGVKKVSEESVAELVQKSAVRYDKDGDEHYDIISAYQKSMRGSDSNAALHYLARLLEAGDLPSDARRLTAGVRREDVRLCVSTAHSYCKIMCGYCTGCRLAGGETACRRSYNGMQCAEIQFRHTMSVYDKQAITVLCKTASKYAL